MNTALRSNEAHSAVTYGDRRHVFISGTASIDRYGEIVHAGDVIKQTSRMIENIEALLKEADATLNDIMQAVIYIRDTADYAGQTLYRRTSSQPPLYHRTCSGLPNRLAGRNGMYSGDSQRR